MWDDSDSTNQQQASALHGCECTSIDVLLLVVDRDQVVNRVAPERS